MSRRWHTKEARALLPSLPSHHEFVSGLPPLVAGGSTLADPTEVYSLYSALFAKGFNPKPQASSDSRFWYLLLQRQDRATAPGTAEQQQQQQEGGGGWQEPLVPVSTGCISLTPEALHRVFEGLPPGTRYYKLALVDRDGTITITKLHSCIQAPEEKIIVAEEEEGEAGQAQNQGA